MVALDALDLLILILGTWRVSSLLTNEPGPWDIFVKVRETFEIGHEDDGYPSVWPDTFMGNLLACVWCVSVWIGLIVTMIYIWNPELTRILLLPFALSTGAILTERVIRG